MYDKDGYYITELSLRFYSTMRYTISHCTSGTKDLPVQPPGEVDKIWIITKTENAIIITCNDLEVLNLVFADSSGSSCATKWGGDVVKEIRFRTEDTASDFYRSGK